MGTIDLISGGNVVHIPVFGAIATMALSLGILLATFVAPLWIIFHYGSRWRASPGLAAQDEKMLADLWDVARRMEDRLGNLERVLGSEMTMKNPGEVR